MSTRPTRMLTVPSAVSDLGWCAAIRTSCGPARGTVTLICCPSTRCRRLPPGALVLPSRCIRPLPIKVVVAGSIPRYARGSRSSTVDPWSWHGRRASWVDLGRGRVVVATDSGGRNHRAHASSPGQWLLGVVRLRPAFDGGRRSLGSGGLVDSSTVAVPASDLAHQCGEGDHERDRG